MTNIEVRLAGLRRAVEESTVECGIMMARPTSMFKSNTAYKTSLLLIRGDEEYTNGDRP
jgi:hypothetical protein